MAFDVTSRSSWSSGTTSTTGTSTSGSFTPTANSRLFVFALGQRDAHTAALAWGITNTGGLSFTALDESALVAWNGNTGYATSVKAWYADVGGSPSSMTVSVDATTADAINAWFYSGAVFDVTGYDTGTPFAQASVDNGASLGGGNSESGTLTLGSSPTSGNLVVGMFGAAGDNTGACSTPTGYTALVSQSQTYTHVGVFYRTDTTTATITSSDLGQTVGNWGGIAFEMTLDGAGGGGTPVAVFSYHYQMQGIQ